MILSSRVARAFGTEHAFGYRLRWWAALVCAGGGGLLLRFASPGTGVWPLALPGIVLILAAWWQQRVGVGLLAGLVAGALFWMPLLSWLTVYLGPLPWLGLSGVMIVWFALQGAATALATRGITALFRSRGWALGAQLCAQAAAAAGIWVLREGVQSSWPYGGFAWGRVAHLFAESPYGTLVSWLGFAGLSGLVVAVCAVLVAWLASRIRYAAPAGAKKVRTSASSRGVVSGSLVVLVVVIALGSAPAAPLERTGTLRVAAVQGNSESGIFDDRESGDVYRGYVEGTEQLLDELERTDERVDLIVWPENAAEFGLDANPLRGREVALLSRRADAPIVLGSVLETAAGGYSNSALVWDGDGQAAPVAQTRYDKRFPVPFAEYMPHREFYRALAPELVDLVQLEYSPGERPPVLPVDAPGGAVLAGVAICFDIIFDDQAVQMVGSGAELILAPTNNADFGRTDESVQQLQIARLRALETGRALVNISTVATSRAIDPSGADLAAITPFTRGSMVAEVPLVRGTTPALRYGAAISTFWMLTGTLGLGAGVAGLLSARRRGTAGPA